MLAIATFFTEYEALRFIETQKRPKRGDYLIDRGLDGRFTVYLEGGAR